MADLPTGTVTFLYTDLEGSSALWERQPQAMRAAVARHDALLRAAIATHHGHVFRSVGDGLCAAFAVAPDSVAAALAAQRALHAEPWGELGPLRVRLALHTGAVEVQAGDYVGACLNRLGRLLAAGHGGQVLLSQTTADLARDALPAGSSLRDLGEQRLRDLTRPEPVYQLLHGSLPDTFPPLRSLDAYSHNLPLQLTSFVGRDHELAEVGALLAAHRLVTLTGVGGGGKTRLALQVAADVIDAHPDGVWFVDLAPLTDPDLVGRAVAGVLGIVEQPGQPILTTLVTTLRTRRLLVVLDNCEHLLDACAVVAEALLLGCPSLRLLATSREALGSAGEVPWRIPSLATPDPAHLPPLDAVMDLAAVRLFVERARVVQPAFSVTDQTALAIARVCRRLDGIPLALELAAARLTALTVDQVAARLDDRFRLLTGGRRTAMRRQQTLAATIDWSHDLLTAPERALFRRLAVFVGGWTLEAAETVGAGELVDAADVLDLLTRLVEKSLVLAEPQGVEERYRLLETVRQYAADKLLAAGEATVVRDRHRAWYAALAARAAPEFGGPEYGLLARLEAEHDNLRAALAWDQAGAASPAAALALAADLGYFWARRDHLAEGIQWLEATLAATPDRTAARARALLHLAELVRFHVGPMRARPLAEEALAIARELGDAAGQARALAQLGLLAATAGDLTAARGQLEASLALTRASGDQRELAGRLRDLALIHATGGELGRARALFEESLARARAAGARGAAGQALLRLGILDRLAGDYAGARARVEECLRLVEAGHAVSGMRRAHDELANLAQAEGRFDAAWAHQRMRLRELAVGGFRSGLSEAVCRAGILAVAQGEAVRGVRLLAAGAAGGQIGTVHSPDIRLEGEATLARVRAALGADAFAAAWAEGEALTLEEAVAEALAEEPAAG